MMWFLYAFFHILFCVCVMLKSRYDELDFHVSRYCDVTLLGRKQNFILLAALYDILLCLIFLVTFLSSTLSLICAQLYVKM